MIENVGHMWCHCLVVEGVCKRVARSVQDTYIKGDDIENFMLKAKILTALVDYGTRLLPQIDTGCKIARSSCV